MAGNFTLEVTYGILGGIWAHFGFNSVPPGAHVRAFSGCTFGLSGRFGGAAPLDPATEPLRLKRGPWSEAN